MKRFPYINHIDDVIEYVDPEFFILVKKEGYQVIDYVISCPDTFPPIPPNHRYIEDGEYNAAAWEAMCRREFRGIIFDMEGKIIRRPWHKFFNVNEKPETTIENVDVSEPHIILDKLDGSMIAPFMLDGKVVWGTKMGLTDVAKPVQEFVDRNSKYEDFALSMINNLGATPIFEWCSRQQRIVLDYPEDQLILTGMRSINTGTYYSHEQMSFFANQHGIPVVKAYEGKLGLEFMEEVRNREDIEGYVIVFEDGDRMKIKCDWYCQLHHVKAAINQERNVVQLILDGKLDDLKSMLPLEDLNRINEYESKFWDSFHVTYTIIKHHVTALRLGKVSRKDFALNRPPDLTKFEVSAIFKMWDVDGQNSEGGDNLTIAIYSYMKDYIARHCTKNVNFEDMRNNTPLLSYCTNFKQVMFDTPETLV